MLEPRSLPNFDYDVVYTISTIAEIQDLHGGSAVIMHELLKNSI